MKENNKKNCETATKKNMAEIDYSAFEMCMACYSTKHSINFGGYGISLVFDLSLPLYIFPS